MRVIGLTGGIACGKTTVAGWLRDMGAPVIDADAISHELTGLAGEALPAIFAAFGERVRLPEGALNRRALASIVFASEAERQKLNRIMHPMIRARMDREIAHCRKMGVSIVVLDVPLLFEAGMADMADEIWCVSAPESVQLSRLKARDGLSREEALARIRSQWPLCEKELRSDAVIDTGKSAEAARKNASQLYLRALERSRE